MGNDGGSIPKRRELVKNAARLPTATELKETLHESLTHAWTTCPLSSQPLDLNSKDTVVSDWRGILYNYESILQCLLPPGDDAAAVPEAQEEAFRQTDIKGVKDVVKLRFTVRKDEKGREFRACPVSLKELGGAATKAVYIVPCGHVFAEAAMKELQATEGNGKNSSSSSGSEEAKKEQEQQQQHCPECSEPFEESNVIPILPTSDAELEKLKTRIDDLKSKGLSHSLKKDKSGGKKKRKAEEAANGEKENGSKKGKKEKETGIESRINNSMTASLTARVLAEQEENTKRRKIAEGRRGEKVR
ncbi:hypothetical protein PG993_011032 [Apiospora rasikravindrae]|uniref:Replication termination factor 2 n=1 Tax=Apiospora rasikravindrae TaxID=990691 RepID=A0ABR1SD04_9PEZI